MTWRRLGVRNLIIAVLDDETTLYMKAHWPDVPTYKVTMQIPSTQVGQCKFTPVSAAIGSSA